MLVIFDDQKKILTLNKLYARTGVRRFGQRRRYYIVIAQTDGAPVVLKNNGTPNRCHLIKEN